MSAVTRELARIDAGIAPGMARPLADIQTEWLRSPRLHAAAVTVFGAASVILTLAGIYARMAHRVASRRREWAVRQALGATPARLRQMVVADVTAVASAGALLGLAALPAASALAAGLLYGANLLDWPRALLVAAGLCAAAVVAADGPSRRATRVESRTSAATGMIGVASVIIPRCSSSSRSRYSVSASPPVRRHPAP